MRRSLSASFLAFTVLAAGPVSAQCPEEGPLQNTAGGTTACLCFIPGEQAGAVLVAPPAHYPIEILRVGVGWGSVFGGAPQSLEQAVNVYGSGLPNPGAPIGSLPGPLLTDGFVNEFDLEPLPGQILVNSGPFLVSLQFLNQNYNQTFAPSVVHDGNGCQPGKNAVFAIPGGWFDACMLGVSGDWVFYVIYRPDCVTGIEEAVASSSPVFLSPPVPNPLRTGTRVEFVLEGQREVELSVHDVAGRRVATLLQGTRGAGHHAVSWDGVGQGGVAAPAGVYFVTLAAGDRRETRKLVVAR